MNRHIIRLDEPDPVGGFTEIIEWPDGRVAYMLEGEFHRLDGPSFIAADGRQAWHINGVEHRDDGPAVIYPDGHEEYWIHGIQLTTKEFASRASG